ncbi:hypothetical protein L3N51_01382 [Metallosphaera sp. J1]|uniref:ArsR/SmtB family transcription factor n=1 Tax=Metallosphaera javensis (ex Hofmann et al. 2022) TaxID=99938 RepID=UPI001EDF091B|nr:metalloregulator ArsR/SmtB family transcription factor [Metallosphaera javensis (ex Hofmann et al. 2022)]MCG3109092.1 hypothetical protein [Metallosphaera javensis (ex Hofmann et al. 2022)]
MDIFEAISNETRRRILQSLSSPKTFSELANELGLDSPSLSFHLRKLDGLVTKNEEGIYRLTDDGVKALNLISMINAGESRLFPMVVEYLNYVKVDNELLIKLRKEGRKLVIRNVRNLDLSEVNSSLLNEVLETIENVDNLSCSNETLSLVKDRIKGKYNLQTQGEERNLNTSEPESPLSNFLSYVTSRLPKLSNLHVVYDDRIPLSNRLEINLNGGLVKLLKGEPHLLAQCHDLGDLDLSQGTINADGCNLNVSYPDLDTLELDINGGKATIQGLKVDSLKADLAGGLLHLGVHTRACELRIDGGKVDGRLSYPVTESSLSLTVEGGIVELSLSLPRELGIITSSSTDLGLTTIPRSRPGKVNLSISTQVQGGLVRIRESD